MSTRNREKLISDLTAKLKNYDFGGTTMDDAWCEQVTSLAPDYVTHLLGLPDFPDFDNEEEIELTLELSELVMLAFVKWLYPSHFGKEEQPAIEDPVLLHVSDWDNEDKYYHAPRALLAEFKQRILGEGMDSAWDWFTTQVDYGRPEDKGLPVQYCNSLVDHSLDDFFLDYTDGKESVEYWEEHELKGPVSWRRST